MTNGLAAAALSAVCYGIGSVLLAIGARQAATPGSVGRRILVRTLRVGAVVAGLGLEGLGFLAQVVALQTLPIFIVQSTFAASLVVTALAAVPLLGVPLTWRQWAALFGVCAGLVLLALSSGAENAHVPASWFQFLLLDAVALLAVVGAAANWLPGRARAVSLAVVAGLSFGVTAIAARSLAGDLSWERLVREPAAYALVAAAVVGYLFFLLGLRRAGVTAVTAMTAVLVIGETVLPSVVGVLVFEDRTRAGFVPAAVVGFVVAVAGSLFLPRYGELAPPAARPAAADADRIDALYEENETVPLP